MNAPVPENTVAHIYVNHQGWLFAWLRRKLRCPHDAADISHDTFLRLLKGEDPSLLREPRAYLLVIASRLMINRRKRRRIEEEALRQMAVLLAQEESRGPAEIIAAQDLLAKVLMMLTEELPEKTRKAFLMARVDGLSYHTIAERLQVCESSVKQYLAKALVHCHTRLYDSIGEDRPQ